MALCSHSHEACRCACVAWPATLTRSRSCMLTVHTPRHTPHNLLPRNLQPEGSVFMPFIPPEKLRSGVSYTADGKSHACWKLSLPLPGFLWGEHPSTCQRALGLQSLAALSQSYTLACFQQIFQSAQTDCFNGSLQHTAGPTALLHYKPI